MRVLKKVPPPKREKKIDDFYVLDIETRGLSPRPENFIFGIIYNKEGYTLLKSPKEAINEISKRKYRNKKIFAHNGEFDFSGIFGNIILNVDNSAVFNGKFIMAKYMNTTLCDSMNILPTSVKKLGDMLGLPKLDIEDEYLKGDGKIKVTEKMIEYCKRDCEIVHTSLSNIFNMVGSIKLTLASLSIYYFRKDFLEHDIVYNQLNDEFFKSYYGGRNEAFYIGEVKADVYDINSLYPHIMTVTRFPDFKNLRKYVNVQNRYALNIIKRKEGLFFGTVFHPESYVGYLPKKAQSGKLLFPHGRYKGHFNFNELRFAIEHGGVEIVECEYLIYSSAIESPFISYINELYGLRLKTENGFLKYLYKLFMNALYGKFAMRKKYKTTYYHQIPYDDIMMLKSKNEYYELKLFSAKRDDCYLITENKHADKSYFSIATVASYITSAARVELLKGILANKENLYYCDTDSIFVSMGAVKGIKIGSSLGEWKKEDKTVTEIRGLKNYSTKEDGKKIKGVSKRAIEIAPYVFKIEKYYKTKESIRRGKNTGEIYIQKKTITNKYEKRIVNKDGTTRALHIIE